MTPKPDSALARGLATEVVIPDVIYPDIGDPIDISQEKWRAYHYPSGDKLIIKNPVTLYIVPRRDGEGHSHRVVDSLGHGWYVTNGWVAIEWYNHDPSPRISF